MTSEPRPETLAADHLFAAWLADTAGERLLEVRATAPEKGLEGKELKDAGDAAANALLLELLARYRPGDAVLSEEARETHGDTARLQADRVWIIDPLDGTREFSEPPRDDWAVHVALWERAGSGGGGDLTVGAVAQPALAGSDRQSTFHTGNPAVLAPRDPSARIRLAVSRSRPPAFVSALAEALDAEVVPMGSAGVKMISVVRDLTDAYVHAGGQYEWDSAAPVAVARAAGLFTSRVDGSPLRYNQRDVYLPDVIVCRPELAEPILTLLREQNLTADETT